MLDMALKIPTRPPHHHITPAQVAHVLEGVRPYGPHVHTWAELAKYFGVSRRTIGNWLANGFDLGLYKGPGRERWLIAITHAELHYEGALHSLRAIKGGL